MKKVLTVLGVAAVLCIGLVLLIAFDDPTVGDVDGYEDDDGIVGV